MHDACYLSASARRTALKYDTGNSNLILVNYESLNGVLKELLALIKDDTLLVFDEVHKVKRVGGKYADAALMLAQQASYIVTMTGTPIPNSYVDVYNLLHFLFPDEYKEFFRFSARMLQKPTQAEISMVNDKLQPFFCRTTKEQLGVPPVNPDTLLVCAANPTENRHAGWRHRLCRL